MLGRSCRWNVDAVTGHSVPPIVVRDVAREVPFIPVAVVFDYRWPARPKRVGGRPALDAVIRAERTLQPQWVRIDLETPGDGPRVIDMSLVGAWLAMVELQPAMDVAIARAAIIVAVTGNWEEEGATTGRSRRSSRRA
jgi:hypothetical protein